jgi:multicomponent Na+:H+ antiporter subunit F
MNAWLVGAAALLAALVPLGLFAFRSPIGDRLVALELAGVLETLALVLLAEGFDRDIYFDLAVVMAVVSFIGTLAYVRFLERWL